MPNHFLPEGQLVYTGANKAASASLSSLQRALEEELVLEGHCVLCTAEHDLLVSLGAFTGRIPREEVALGIREGSTKEIAILSRVGKPLCFVLTAIDWSGEAPMLTLSRRRAQELALTRLLSLPRGSILPAVVTHMEQFGAFVDLGCGFVSMIGVENISISRMSHPNRRFALGQRIYVLLTGIEQHKGRVLLSHKELLGTWQENAARFSCGMTVAGFVRGIKNYGIFIELTPNLCGLADFSPHLREDEQVSVYIKSITPDRMKIKLSLIARLGTHLPPPPLHYWQTEGTLTRWHYAPKSSGEGNEGLFSTAPLCL